MTAKLGALPVSNEYGTERNQVAPAPFQKSVAPLEKTIQLILEWCEVERRIYGKWIVAGEMCRIWVKYAEHAQFNTGVNQSLPNHFVRQRI